MHSDNPMPKTAPPLSGHKVIDLTMYLSGPLCSMLLGDMGADVIKIENPNNGGDPMRTSAPPSVGDLGAYFFFVNRNKRSLALDLKLPAGREAFLRVVRDADVLVENFRPGVMDRLGLGYDELVKINPRLVYCAISGFGETGPLAGLPAFDHVMQAYSGWMSVTGTPETGPLRTGSSIADILGGLYATMAVSFGLLSRAQTGAGQKVSTSLLDALTASLYPSAVKVLTEGVLPELMGNSHPITVPIGTYQASDGMISISIGSDQQWLQLCRALGAEQLGAEQSYHTNEGRSANRAVLQQAVSDIIRTRSVDDWVERMAANSVPCSPVNDLFKLFASPQVAHNNGVVEVMHPSTGPVRVINNPLRLHQRPVDEWLLAPLLGEHTAEILLGCGYSEQDLDGLEGERVIRRAQRQPDATHAPGQDAS